MKWLGQYIQSFTARFRDDVYIENIGTSTETDMVVVNSAGLLSKRAIDAITVDVSDFMTNGSDNRVLTATGTDAMNAEANLTFDGSTLALTGDITATGDTFTFQSSNADDPIVTIKNTSNNPNDMASLKFVKDRGSAPAIGDNLAEIYFIGEDHELNSQEYGSIICETDVVTDGQESGVLYLRVANHDGGSGNGLILTGGSEDNEIDVTVGLGASSVVTIPGNIDMAGDIDVDGTTNLDNTQIGGTVIHEYEVSTDVGNTTQLLIDHNLSGLDAQNSTALRVDFDRDVASTGTAAHNDIGIDLDVNSASLGTSSLKGMDIDVVGATSGTSTATGIDLTVSGADNNIGIQITAGRDHLKLIAADDANDYATLSVANTGDLTIETVGDGSADSDLTLDADGQIKLEPASGRNILLDGTIGVDAGVVTGATSITSTAFVGTLSTASQPNITGVGTIGTGVWNGTKITDIYTNASGKRYGSTIKILPSDFMISDDEVAVDPGGDGDVQPPLSFKDGSNSGVHIADTASEVLAFVAIPEGMKATAVDIFATHNRVVNVFEVDLDDTYNFTGTPDEVGACNTQITVDPAINATADNYLAIQVVLNNVNNRIWGGKVTIAAQ